MERRVGKGDLLMTKKFIAGVVGAAAVAAAVSLAPSASAGPSFDVCPSGYSGVIGGHTSCPFADIVANGYYQHGAAFEAYSPVTDQWYGVVCTSGYLANFTNGHSHLAARCFAGTNAQVVVW